MEALNEALPVVIYLLLIVLLVVGIVIGIKLIFTMSKIDELLDDVTKKVKTLDRVFNIIDYTTDKVSMISDTVVNFVTSKLKKIIRFKKSNDDEEDEIDE